MLLDEPTTGVDPAARRKMWETINNIRRFLPIIYFTLLLLFTQVWNLCHPDQSQHGGV